MHIPTLCQIVWLICHLQWCRFSNLNPFGEKLADVRTVQSWKLSKNLKISNKRIFYIVNQSQYTIYWLFNGVNLAVFYMSCLIFGVSWIAVEAMSMEIDGYWIFMYLPSSVRRVHVYSAHNRVSWLLYTYRIKMFTLFCKIQRI